MATTTVANSSIMGCYVGGTLVGEIDDATLSITEALRDVSNKTTGRWTSRLSGQLDWQMTAGALYIPNDTWGFPDAFAALNAGTSLSVVYQSSVAADDSYTGNCYISSANNNSPGHNQNVVWDVTFDGDGALTEGATS